MLLYAIKMKGNKLKVEKTSCHIKDDICVSFKVSISVNEMEAPIIDKDEISFYTNDEKKVPSAKRLLPCIMKEVKKQNKLLSKNKSRFVTMP